ncbi:PREDICTED: non-lysosomal glucosylceramidase-like isoform X2 [Priapulus caudatus]|nr:PREDICTED: non-lysosomal glucosylceramidase-like isoform X2 [Priapulus caudatus]
MCYWIKLKLANRTAFIDQLSAVKCKQIYGVPIGGIGCGTIGRGWKGEFCRYQLIPGMYRHHTILANQFIVTIRMEGTTVYQQVLSPKTNTKSQLRAWKWGFDGANAFYHALYPRSWMVYNIAEHSVRLICRQVSPVIPHDYQDSSIPCAVFVWEVENSSADELDISIAFTFKNGMGCSLDRAGGCQTEAFSASEGACSVKGVQIHQSFKQMSCTYGLAIRETAGVQISHKLHWNPKGSGTDIWDDLLQSGSFSVSPTTEKSEVTRKGQEIACAVCAKMKAKPHCPVTAEMCLVWDMPRIRFGAGEQQYYRRYTRWFGREGKATPRLCSYALSHYEDWENKISTWQMPVLEDSKLPDWYKSALFNELYFMADGGTVWVDVDCETVTGVKPVSPAVVNPHKLIQEYGKFAYLEGHEYRMYNTYDVHFYASFALAMLWPNLELSLLYDVASVIQYTDDESILHLFEGNTDVRKLANAVPHDMGDPDDEPWERVNGYRVHDTGNWKDLNLKFVLQVYRDYLLQKDKQLLVDMWPLVQAVIKKGIEQDSDKDGIIDNTGADQTYDAWRMYGASAYCGGLWLAALKAACEIGTIIDSTADTVEYAALLEQGKESYYKKLWTGRFYLFDCSGRDCANSIMSDQLAGYWYLKACGIEAEVFPPETITTALRTIYENNVLKFEGGTMGAVNAMRTDGSIDTFCLQGEETWTGTSYALAATMIQEGMVEEGFHTAEGVYRSCYERLGLGFQTPEALYAPRQKFRSLGYMRALAIWSIQWALENVQPL